MLMCEMCVCGMQHKIFPEVYTVKATGLQVTTLLDNRVQRDGGGGTDRPVSARSR